MKTYVRTIFVIVQGGFLLVPFLAILIVVASVFDHPLRASEIGATVFIVGIGIAGFFLTRLIRRIVTSSQP